MRFKSEPVELLGSGFDARGIVTAIEVGGYGQAGFGGRGSDEVEDFLVAVERFTRPVFRDFREETVLNGVPLGSAGGVVSDRDVEGEAVGELGLQLRFPSAAAATIATTRVGENQQLAGTGCSRVDKCHREWQRQ